MVIVKFIDVVLLVLYFNFQLINVKLVEAFDKSVLQKTL